MTGFGFCLFLWRFNLCFWVLFSSVQFFEKTLCLFQHITKFLITIVNIINKYCCSKKPQQKQSLLTCLMTFMSFLLLLFSLKFYFLFLLTRKTNLLSIELLPFLWGIFLDFILTTCVNRVQMSLHYPHSLHWDCVSFIKFLFKKAKKKNASPSLKTSGC